MEAWAVDTGLELSNGALTLRLGVNSAGVPFVASAAWCGKDAPLFEARTTESGWAGRAPEGLHPEDGHTEGWRRVDDPVFLRAESNRVLAKGLTMTFIVELAREGSLFRQFVRMANTGDESRPVEWFPVASLSWAAPGKSDWVRWWSALSFTPVERSLGVKDIVLGSRIHSSDLNPTGQNPYWICGGEHGQLCFSLDWCGGWRAMLKRGPDGALECQAYLPPEETQLTLAPGERMTGPVLAVTATEAADGAASRADWMRQRTAAGQALYGGPAPWYPLAYNHWYTTRFSVDGAFLDRQVKALDAYGFDLFVVDAGWYQAVGQWTPDPAKFAPGQFERIMQDVKAKGVKAGIWSCPQFVKADKDALPPEVDEPPFYRKFIDGYLVDYAGMDFTKYLLDHVAMLRSRYAMDWWKYDQDFFVEKTRHGMMKNVTAFEKALLAVRKAQPDLYMENCQSGGRMINEFTAFLTQNQWIRDGGSTGPEHARNNFAEALGALEFLPPWTVNRWTNNPDRNDPADDEFTRMYCRSAMAGTWGIVADLDNITPHQRDIILREVANYRRLNALKSGCRYIILRPEKGADAAGVVYLDAQGRHAGVLLLRWDQEGAFEIHVPLSGFSEDSPCKVEDVDAGATVEMASGAAAKDGVTVPFPAARRSALLFVDAVPPS
jgi:alpha-galactosidase